MINKLKPKSEFSRNVLTLMTGTTIAQSIPIAISPILTRIYTPEDFGVFALYMSIASLFSVMATGRYELAIMLPEKDSDAINIVALSIIISFFISFISFIVIYVFNAKITDLLGNPEIATWLYFIPVAVLLTGIYQSLNYWSNRKKQYKRLAASRVIQSGTTAAVNLGMGLGGFGSSGLILGSVLGQGVTTTILGKLVWQEDRQRLLQIKTVKIFSLAKKHKKLPIYNLPNAIIDGFRLSGISILIAKFFTAATLGQFSLAFKMVQTPMSLISSSLSQVFYQKVSSSKRSDLYRIVVRFILKASLVAIPVFLFIYLFADDIFVFIFGENWKLAGEAASVLTPWLFLNFISSPLGTILIVLNKQEVILNVSMIYALVPVLILMFFHEFGFLEILSMVTMCMSVILLFYILYIVRYTKKEANAV
ncbi:lipopolysaccharide biosynthesis protein [Sulfurovum sp. NBC37-1]|uniref:lipopolysaccharide biosynthesis protein n=1 Tax=Sulfurovum sp. (strain NBC37-1) TaxID=387093 RepID=UPI0001587839|nr:oligosaccharide flippase family protein [Sulfurovum sp. NBC37-1]BAF71056.1 polysaccharide biosynthesis protein [Sulfurovum sp. NBC37-1]